MISNKSIFLVLLLAFSVRVAAVRVSDAFTKNEGDDARHYRLLGINLARGNGYSADEQAPFAPDPIREPLYPLFLAACFTTMGESVVHVRLLQAIIDTLNVYFVYLLALHALGGQGRLKRPGAIIAACLYAFLPCAIRNAVVLVREPLFILLLLISVWLLRSRPWVPGSALICGTLLGFAALCRANLQLLPFALLPLLIRRSRTRSATWRPALIFIVVYLAVITPWYVRNYVRFGFIGLSPTLGINLFQRTWNFDFTGSKEPELRALVKRATELPDGAGDDSLYTLTVAYRTKALLDPNLPAWEIDRRFRAVALENIVSHPWKYVGTSLQEMGRWWYATDNYSRFAHGFALGFDANLRARQWLQLLFIVAGYVFATLLLALVVLSAIRWRRTIDLELAIVAYFAVTTCLVQICYLSRYWLVAAPFVAVTEGVAGANILRICRWRRTSTTELSPISQGRQRCSANTVLQAK